MYFNHSSGTSFSKGLVNGLVRLKSIKYRGAVYTDPKTCSSLLTSAYAKLVILLIDDCLFCCFEMKEGFMVIYSLLPS
jgi:hypothetical protein